MFVYVNPEVELVTRPPNCLDAVVNLSFHSFRPSLSGTQESQIFEPPSLPSEYR